MADPTPAQTPSTTQSDATAPAAPRKRRWGRIVGVTIAAILLVLVLVAALLPTLLSTGPGTRFVTDTVNKSIAGRVTIADLSLGWLGGQVIRGIEVFDPQDAFVARVDEIAAPDLALIPVALGSREFGSVRVAADVVNLKQAANQPTNLQLAFASPAGAQTTNGEAPVSRDTTAPRADNNDAGGDAPTDLGDVSVQLEVTAKQVTYEDLSGEMQPVELNNLRATADVPDLSNVHVVVTSDLKQAGATGRIDADMHVRDAFTADGVMQLESAKVEGKTEVVNLPVPMIDRLAEQGGKLVALLGEQLSATVQTQGELQSLTAQVTASSERLKLNTQLRRTANGLEASGGTGSLQMTPEAFALLAADPTTPAEEQMRLLEPFTLNLDLRSLVVPTAADGAVAVGDTRLDAVLTSDRLALAVPGQGDVRVDNLSLATRTEKLSERVTAQLTGRAQLAGTTEPLPVQADVTVVNLPGLTAPGAENAKPMEATLTTRRLPVALIDAVSGQGGKIAQTLGQSLDANVKVVQGKDGLGFEGDIDATNLKGPFLGTYSPSGAIRASTPEPLRFTFTPGAYRAWLIDPEAPAGQLALAEDAELSIKLQEVRYAALPAAEGAPADATTRVDPEQTGVVADITAPSLVFANAQERIRATDAAVRIDGRDLRQVLKIAANLKVDPQRSAAGDAGTIASETEARGLVNDRNELSTAGAEISSKTLVKNVPSSLLDALAMQGGELAAVLGATTNAGIDLQQRPNGAMRIDAQVDATNVKGNIPARVRPNGDLELREDATMSVNVTPEVSRVMLGKVNPMLRHAVSAEVPMKLTVAAQEFNVPTKEFNWNKVNAVAGLDTGTLTLQPEGFVGVLLQGLRLIPQVSQYIPSGNFAANITPVNFNINRGRMSYRDLRVAFSGIELDFDGAVNLGQGMYDLSMTLGGETLGSDLRGLSVPISGSFDRPMSADTMAKALGGAALQGGLLDAVLGGKRDRERSDEGETRDRPRGDEPISRDPDRPRDRDAEEDRPRDPLGGLLDAVLERERQKQEERRREESE